MPPPHSPYSHLFPPLHHRIVWAPPWMRQPLHWHVWSLRSRVAMRPSSVELIRLLPLPPCQSGRHSRGLRLEVSQPLLPLAPRGPPSSRRPTFPPTSTPTSCTTTTGTGSINSHSGCHPGKACRRCRDYSLRVGRQLLHVDRGFHHPEWGLLYTCSQTWYYVFQTIHALVYGPCCYQLLFYLACEFLMAPRKRFSC